MSMQTTKSHHLNAPSKNKTRTRLVGIFKGKSSQGFVSGKEYFLRSRVGECTIHGKPMCCIVLSDVNSRACCPYQSLESLLENWDIKYVK